ncbi:MAG: hypothetical protein ACLTE4_12020, partial [Christensenellaceae bacterium]
MILYSYNIIPQNRKIVNRIGISAHYFYFFMPQNQTRGKISVLFHIFPCQTKRDSAAFTAALPFAALALIQRRPRENRLITPVLTSCLLLLVPIIVQPVNRMWHTGSYQGFPTRYG